MKHSEHSRRETARRLSAERDLKTAQAKLLPAERKNAPLERRLGEVHEEADVLRARLAQGHDALRKAQAKLVAAKEVEAQLRITKTNNTSPSLTCVIFL